VRSYARVRAGQDVQLAARPVTVQAFDVLALRRPEPGLLDVDVTVTCSTGTYVRALARDLGSALGVGGHLTALRRTAVGRFSLAEASTLDELATREDPVGSRRPILRLLSPSSSLCFRRRPGGCEPHPAACPDWVVPRDRRSDR